MAAPTHATSSPPEVVTSEIDSPALANLVVVIGFGLLFTTFATDSAWSWILGAVLILAGGLWAGFSGRPRPTTLDSGPPAAPGRVEQDDGHAA